MRVLTWNVNGIRAGRVILKDLFDSLDADVICIQETKVTSQYNGVILSDENRTPYDLSLNFGNVIQYYDWITMA